MIRVIAVDDEPLALKQLESYISKIPFFELAGSCRSALEARTLLSDNVIDAMFLDINMPDLSGLEFVRLLASPPLVVFTTAYAEYAVEGFRVDAVDYLLKPFSLADFIKTAERVKSRFEALNAASSSPAPVNRTPNDDAIFFRTDYKSVRVKLDEIRYVESMSEYIKVYTDKSPNPIIVLLGLKHLMDKLPPERFMRIHRSYIVALGRIREIGKAELVLEDGTALPIGDLYRQELKDYLSKNSL